MMGKSDYWATTKPDGSICFIRKKRDCAIKETLEELGCCIKDISGESQKKVQKKAWEWQKLRGWDCVKVKVTIPKPK